MGIDLKRLRYLIEIIECGSLSRAAVSLGVAQSALSRHVSELEEEFGQRLLVRTGRGVVPTDFASRFLPRIRSIVDQADELLDDIRSAQGEVVGRVRLGILQSLSSLILTPLLVAVSAQFPRLVISVREGLADHIDDWLLTGQVDLGVLYADHSGHSGDTHALMTCDLYLVGPKSLFGDPPAAMALSEAIRYPLLLPSVPNRWRLTIDQSCMNLGVRPNISYEINSLSTILDLLKTTHYFTIAPLHTVQRDVEGGFLGFSRIVDPEITRDVILAFSKRGAVSNGCGHVASLIRKQVQAHIVSGALAGRRPARSPQRTKA